MEKALEVWAQKMGDHGFPPRLNSFKAMTQELAELNAEQMGDSTLAEHEKAPPTPGSNLDRRITLAGSSGPIIDHLHMLKQALKEYIFLPGNVCGMDKRGFALGIPNCAKVICRAGRHHPRAIQDETRELISQSSKLFVPTQPPSLYCHEWPSLREPLTVEAVTSN